MCVCEVCVCVAKQRNHNIFTITAAKIPVMCLHENYQSSQATRLMASSKMAVKNDPQAARLIAGKRGRKIDGR